MQTIVLISCATKKKTLRTRAEELYESPLFVHSLRYARTLNPDKIFILSAKHGLLDLEREIEPYDVTLSKMSASQVREWARGVLEQLRKCADLRRDRFVILAGNRYRKYLLPHLASCEVPLKGLGIGKQLQYLIRHT